MYPLADQLCISLIPRTVIDHDPVIQIAAAEGSGYIFHQPHLPHSIIANLPIDGNCQKTGDHRTVGQGCQIVLRCIGAAIGLVSQERLQQVQEKYDQVQREMNRLESNGVPGSPALNTMLEAKGSAPVANSARLADLLRRPNIGYADIAPFDPGRPELSAAVAEEVEIQIKYAGYLARQEKQVAEFKKEESRLLPGDIDYNAIAGLRLEAREKLQQIRPMSIGQAGRISGVSPSDIAVLLIWLETK